MLSKVYPIWSVLDVKMNTNKSEAKNEIKIEPKSDVDPLSDNLTSLEQKCKDLEEENRVRRDAETFWRDSYSNELDDRRLNDGRMERSLERLEDDNSRLEEQLEEANEELEQAKGNLEKAKIQEANQTRSSQQKAAEINRLMNLTEKIGKENCTLFFKILFRER